MKNGKRIIGLFMVLAMACSVLLCSFPTFAEPVTYDISAAQDGSLTAVYEPTTNTLTISGSGEMKNYTSYNSIPWYSNRTGIHNVVFEEACGITNFSDYMFYNYSNLSSIEIPSSVISIGYGAFYSNKGLTTITIPSSVTTIGKQAFYSCSNLTNITIEGNNVTFGTDVFSACTNVSTFNCLGENLILSEQIFGNKVSSASSVLGYKATNKKATVQASEVYLTEALTSLGYTVSTIGTATEEDKWDSYPSSFVFNVGANGDNIKAYFNQYSGSLDLIGSGATKGYASNKYNTDIRNYLSQTNVLTIDEGITEIGAYFFYGGNYNTGLGIVSEIKLPSTLTKIGEGAFQNAAYYSGLRLTIPASVEVIGKSAFSSAKNMRSITFEEGSKLTTIPESCFSGCENISSIEVPDSVKVIERLAFSNCKSATSIELPLGIERIDVGAFSNCTNVSTFICPSENVVIEGCIFGDYLSSVKTTMGYNATNKVATVNAKQGYMIEGLTLMGYDVTVEGTATEEDYYNSFATDCVFEIGNPVASDVIAYFNEYSGKMVLIGTGSTISTSYSTRRCLFYETYGQSTYIKNLIKEAEIKEGITKLGDNLFYDVTYMTQISLPSTLTEIGEYALSNVKSLKTVEIPANVELIEQYAFSSLTNATSITFESGSKVTTIPERCFSGCTSLTTFTIPESVEEIDKSAFYNDTKLQIIYNLSEDNQTINANSFERIASSPTVYMYSANTAMKEVATVSMTTPTIVYLDEVDMPLTGTLENGIVWTYYPDSKTITFEGDGEVPNYTEGQQPWYGAMQQYGNASTYYFGDGISSVGNGSIVGGGSGTGLSIYGGSGAVGSLSGAYPSASFGGTGSFPGIGGGSGSGGGTTGGGSTDGDNNNTGGTSGTGIEVYTKDFEETEFSQVEFPDAQPFISNNVVYTPIRFVNEKLGAEVYWSNSTRTATLRFKENGVDKEVKMRPDTTEMTVKMNGITETIDLDATIILTEERLFLPGEEIVKAWSDWEFSKDRSSVTLYKDYYTRTVPYEEPTPPTEDEGDDIGELATDDNIGSLLKTFDNTAIIVNQNATNFKVTVPFVVNITMTADAEISVTEGLSVKNECAWGPVVIKGINVVTKTTWSIADFENTDFINMPADSKVLGMSINDSPVKVNGLVDLNESLGSVIKYQSEKDLFFEAKLSAQTRTLNDTIAAIVFTLDWDKVE